MLLYTPSKKIYVSEVLFGKQTQNAVLLCCFRESKLGKLLSQLSPEPLAAIRKRWKKKIVFSLLSMFSLSHQLILVIFLRFFFSFFSFPVTFRVSFLGKVCCQFNYRRARRMSCRHLRLTPGREISLGKEKILFLFLPLSFGEFLSLKFRDFLFY